MNALKINKFIYLTLFGFCLWVSLTLAVFVGFWNMEFEYSQAIDKNQQDNALKLVEDFYSHLACPQSAIGKRIFQSLKQFQLYEMDGNGAKVFYNKRILEKFRDVYWCHQKLDKAKFLDPSGGSFELEIEGTSSNQFVEATRWLTHKAIFKFNSENNELVKVNFIHQEQNPESSTHEDLIQSLRFFLSQSEGTSTS
ncbi:uncharacterized protein MELLADRAFT_62784 [Melampsora larici-populina 98AG31]|uniref:Uncharacterized protein n=1 Tax=Melampsora larici-populina (strain 98AG31 / pathotype 3-4-7) TaxID=747676 RepID=F4RK84_MELLP|nr:uncharacterized protein MELLADRAFT_62784 [Melampsora larici-populina 98AG31]EGG07228.1 hypothetical protein MELLADRAFT_62784 [Melampsora larici-populina 98AG31]